MKTVDVRGLRIGEGIPKICVSLLGKSVGELKQKAEMLKDAGVDLAEWRVDWFDDWSHPSKVLEALNELRSALGELPLLVTFRTKKEGGEAEITGEQYKKLYETVVTSGYADLIDLELFFESSAILDLISLAKNYGVKTVLSNHDFERTPEKEELIRRLKNMELLGADIAKIAVMPQSAGDVALVLGATAAASNELSCPIITMAMGELGVISRMAGQVFGSAVTFAALGTVSAPGQVPLEKLKEVLELVDSLQ